MRTRSASPSAMACAIFDALMIAAALRARCTVLYSEDMQHGMAIDGRLRIVDPFRDP